MHLVDTANYRSFRNKTPSEVILIQRVFMSPRDSICNLSTGHLLLLSINILLVLMFLVLFLIDNNL